MNHSYRIFGLIGAAIIIAASLRFLAPRKGEVFEQTAIVMTSDALYQEFKNDKETHKKYSGKLLELTGTVERLGESGTGRALIVLKSGDSLGEIQCIFSKKTEEKARQLKPGEKVTLKGICLGKVIHVFLDECSLAG